MKYKVGDLVIDKGVMQEVYKGDIGKVVEVYGNGITIKWIYMKNPLQGEDYLGAKNAYDNQQVDSFFKIISKEKAMVEML